MKILAKTWFTPMGSDVVIGIVVSEMDVHEQEQWDSIGPISAWIGNSTPGTDETIDAVNIVRTGARFPLEGAVGLFGPLDKLQEVVSKQQLAAPTVTTFGKASMQVCVPGCWTDTQAIAFANKMNPNGTGWVIRKKDDNLTRVSCSSLSRSGFVHIMLDC